jgi:hypothetical protein
MEQIRAEITAMLAHLEPEDAACMLARSFSDYIDERATTLDDTLSREELNQLIASFSSRVRARRPR